MPSPSNGGGAATSAASIAATSAASIAATSVAATSAASVAASSAATTSAASDADGKLFFLVHQYLVENNLHDTARMFEKESGSFFSLRRFKRAVIAGDWDEAEWYVSGFTYLDSNPQSKQLFFELRRMKYFDARDRREREKETRILSNDLTPFDMKDALTTPPVRSMILRRDWAFEELQGLIEKNPDFKGKLKKLPELETSSLRTIFGASLITSSGRRPPALAVRRGVQVQEPGCENAESKKKRKTWAEVVRSSPSNFEAS